MNRDQIESLKANAKLDVRLPDQLKDAFLARCRAEGVSSGAVIRSLILDYLKPRPRLWPAMAARVKETIVQVFTPSHLVLAHERWICAGCERTDRPRTRAVEE